MSKGEEIMYRAYEDPYSLERELKRLEHYKDALGEIVPESSAEEYEIREEYYRLTMEIEELKSRISFAWEDMYEDEF